jgi:ABC-2 type transport system ATP-binding protein
LRMLQEMKGEYAIETVALEKIYRSRFRGREIRAVSNLNLRVPEGVKFGLLGANGAGKTTFVKMLLAAVHPTSGTARLFGREARESESRRPVGYLPENHRFPTYLTGNGMLDFYAALSGMSSSDRRRRIPELLSLVGLETWGDIRIKKYSKGMLQRLGLAQAMMHRPRLLVLDEPTDGVDPLGRRQIREVLNGLSHTGVTIFINSHLLSEVELFCDQVAIINRGKLALEGRIRDLISGRGYRITASHVPTELRDAIAAAVSSFSLNAEILDAQVSTLDDLNALIDLLRQAGALIESVTPSSSTLEEIFIQTTRQAAPGSLPEPELAGANQ